MPPGAPTASSRRSPAKLGRGPSTAALLVKPRRRLSRPVSTHSPGWWGGLCLPDVFHRTGASLRQPTCAMDRLARALPALRQLTPRSLLDELRTPRVAARPATSDFGGGSTAIRDGAAAARVQPQRRRLTTRADRSPSSRAIARAAALAARTRRHRHALYADAFRSPDGLVRDPVRVSPAVRIGYGPRCRRRLDAPGSRCCQPYAAAPRRRPAAGDRRGDRTNSDRPILRPRIPVAGPGIAGWHPHTLSGGCAVGTTSSARRHRPHAERWSASRRRAQLALRLGRDRSPCS